MQFVQVDGEGRPEPLDDEPDERPLVLEPPWSILRDRRVNYCISGDTARRFAWHGLRCRRSRWDMAALGDSRCEAGFFVRSAYPQGGIRGV